MKVKTHLKAGQQTQSNEAMVEVNVEQSNSIG
jgi:hypothetical protein